MDDHAAFRQSLAFMLELQPGLGVMGTAGSVEEAAGMLDNVDVAILDLDLGTADGASLIPALLRRSPSCMVLILTASNDRLALARAVEAGAAGLMHKSAGLDEIVAAVKRLGAGEPLIAPSDAVELIREAGDSLEGDRQAQVLLARLTARERDVLRVLTEGLSDREIGERLGMGTETVRTHMVKILAKLEVDSRLQAAIFAIRRGIVVLD